MYSWGGLLVRSIPCSIDALCLCQTNRRTSLQNTLNRAGAHSITWRLPRRCMSTSTSCLLRCRLKHEPKTARLPRQLEADENAVRAQQEPQQEQKPHKQPKLTPPPKKKVKVNQISGPDQAGLWNQAAPLPPSQAVAGPPRDAASVSRPPRPDSLNPAITAAQRVVSAAAASAAAATMTTEAAAAAAAAASAGVTATGPAGVAAGATGSTVQQEQQRQPRPLSRIKSINSNGNGSWRRLLNHRSSFILENGGDVCDAGGGLLTSCSSWSDRGGGGGGGGGRGSGAQSPVFEISDATVGPFGEPAALATAAGPVQQRGVQGSAGGFGPVAEPLESVSHVKTHPYGMGDWLLSAGVTPTGDLLEAVSGVPAAAMLAGADHQGVVPPLAGGGGGGGGVSCVATGGDYQF